MTDPNIFIEVFPAKGLASKPKFDFLKRRVAGRSQSGIIGDGEAMGRAIRQAEMHHAIFNARLFCDDDGFVGHGILYSTFADSRNVLSLKRISSAIHARKIRRYLPDKPDR